MCHPFWAKRLGLKHWSLLYDAATYLWAGSYVIGQNMRDAKEDAIKALRVYRAGPKMAAGDCNEACSLAYANDVMRRFVTRDFN